jgi:ATP-dependent Lon protease
MALGVHDTWFEDHDIHIHVPAGAVPKDGPSAGITIATALVSLVTGRPVSDDVAMTGEITLTGQVLPIGGVKEKVLAAERAGIATVILPSENEPDLEELPADVRARMRFRLAESITEVIETALDGSLGASITAGRREPKAASGHASESANPR